MVHRVPMLSNLKMVGQAPGNSGDLRLLRFPRFLKFHSFLRFLRFLRFPRFSIYIYICISM